VKSFAEEIVTEKELLELFEMNDKPAVYDGFRSSGLAHILVGVRMAEEILY